MKIVIIPDPATSNLAHFPEDLAAAVAEEVGWGLGELEMGNRDVKMGNQGVRGDAQELKKIGLQAAEDPDGI